MNRHTQASIDGLNDVSYDLADDEREVLVDKVALLLNDSQEQRDFVVAVSGSNPLSNLGRDLERTVLDDAFGEVMPYTPETMVDQYSAYDPHTTFYMYFSQDVRMVVGCLRVIDGVENSKSLRDLLDLHESSPLPLDSEGIEKLSSKKIWDVATLCTDPKYRGPEVTPAVYHAMYAQALPTGVQSWLAILDVPYRHALDIFGLPISSLLLDNAEFSYFGSASYAVEIPIPAVADSMVLASLGADQSIKEVISGMLIGTGTPVVIPI